MWNVSWGMQGNETRCRQSKVAWGTDGTAKILTLTLEQKKSRQVTKNFKGQQ